MESLAELLTLAPDGEDAFTAPSHGPEGGLPRLFGGHVAGQALMAAVRTVEPGRPAHSIHCAFVRPGRPGVHLRLEVTRDRDGRSFSTRRVRVSQEDTVIFDMIASFHVEEPGEDWTAAVMPDVPAPDDVPPIRTFIHGLRTINDVFEWRATIEAPPDRLFLAHPMWVRPVVPIEDPALHLPALASMSDIASSRGAMRLDFELQPGQWSSASLDHAMWFHRPVTLDDWLLLTTEPLTNHGARGVALGRVFTLDGLHVATWMQESLIRLLPSQAR